MTTFRDFMESSLYERGRGFYGRREAKADFYTAPELHPVFAEILTAELCARLKKLAARHPKEPLFIVEMGSGNGTLARQVLRCLKDSYPQWHKRARYVMVERVESLLLDGILSAHHLADRILGYSRIEDVPCLNGVLFSNELVDAMPVHLLEKRDGRMHEVYVEKGGEARLGPLSRPELAAPARAVAPELPEGGRHAVNLEMLSWIGAAARVLKDGSLITIDYGKRFAPSAPNPPRAFYRHSTGPDVLARPGEQDVTASVDFGALMRAGRRHGLHTSSFTTLGRFLLDRGIVGRLPSGDGAAEYQERNRVKTLFHPEGMGEAFKVLIQEKTP